MITADKRRAVYLLYQEGTGVRQIARQLNASINTVRTIIGQKGQMPETVRKDQIGVDPDLLIRLYNDCQGKIQRIHEKLTEEQGLCMAYPTLTKIIREQGLGKDISGYPGPWNGLRCCKCATGITRLCRRRLTEIFGPDRLTRKGIYPMKWI